MVIILFTIQSTNKFMSCGEGIYTVQFKVEGNPGFTEFGLVNAFL
jgi:hypothetical protein